MKLHAWLFKRVLRLDMDGAGPPWPVQIYNRETDAFEEVGMPQSPASHANGLLSLPPLARSGIIDGAYLATSDTLAVLTAAYEPIATQPLRVVSMEEHILTGAGAVIVV